MRRAGKQGSSRIRWFLKDATTFTIIFLIIALVVILDPLGNSTDNNLCASNDTNLRCNTGQLQATPNSLALTLTNKATTDIILESVTVQELNGVTVDQDCHDQDTLIRRSNTYPVSCDSVSLTAKAINEATMSFKYYQSGKANTKTTTGKVHIFIEPTW